MAAFALPLMIASAAVSAVGSLEAASANAASFTAQKNMANYNATVERTNANAAMSAASANEMAMRRDNDVKLSFERGRMIESGGGLVGTNVGALDQAGTNLELSALNARYRGAMEARGDLQQSVYDEYQANIAGQNASNAKSAGWIGAIGGALGTAANYSNYRSLAGGYGGF